MSADPENYEVKDKEETKSRVMESNPSISLSCGHTIIKNEVIYSAFRNFVKRHSYNYNVDCKVCNNSPRLRYIPLYCGCIWKEFGKKIKFSNDLTKGDYGKCDKGHPLTSIDVGLLNDHINFKFTSLMLSDFQQEKQAFMDFFSESTNVREVEDILWVLRYSKALTKLSFNKISRQDRELILNALKTNESVRVLDFNKAVLETEDIKSISEVLKVNLIVTELSLRNCALTDESVKIICEALKTNTALTSLFLDQNNIEDEGMKSIDELLKINNTLELLDLSENKITDKYVGLVCEALKVNTALKWINLRKNKLEAEGKKLLNEVKVSHNLMEILH